jgi:hypothetical protein
MRFSLAALSLGASAFAMASIPGRASAQASDAPPAAPAAPAPQGTPAPSAFVQATSLRDLHDRGLMSDAEYDSAVRDIGASTGEVKAGDAMSLALGRWSTTIYGFAEADTIYDTTQSFSDLAGNAPVIRAAAPKDVAGTPYTTYGGTTPQTQFSVRNSRFGLRLKPPGNDVVRTSGMLEMDFLGSQSEGYGSGQVTQNTFFTSPTLRIRHAMFRVETPVVDVLVGQYWHLFGWQGVYHPNTVEIQGVPGELYARTPQVRISKTLRAHPITVEIAVGAMRPPSAGSAIPELEGGVRLAVDTWTGMMTNGATATSIQPASIAFTGDYRTFVVPAINTLLPTTSVGTSSTSLAADAFLPILPASKEHRDNALSVTGELVYGAGISDMYSGLSGGMQFPFIPNNTGLNTVPVWPQNIDNGLVNYDITGFALHPVQWTSYIVGLQYYLPALKGKVWVSGNYSHMQSRDTSFLGNYSGTSDFARSLSATNGSGVNAGISSLSYYFQTSAGQVRASEDWWDANVFYEPVPSVRIGLELAEFIDHYVDGYSASNIRAQASGYFLF